MDPVQYLRAFRRHWHVLVGAVLLAGVVAWLTTSTVAPVGSQPTLYEATAILWDGGGLETGNLSQISLIATTSPMLERVAAHMGFEGEPETLGARVQVIPDTEAGVLNFTVIDPSAREAEGLASAFAETLPEFLHEEATRGLQLQVRYLELQLAQLRESPRRNASLIRTYQEQLSIKRAEIAAPPSLRTLQEARARPLPTTGFQPPGRAGRLGIAALFGLIAGVVIVLIRERFDTRIRTRQVAEESFGLPVLAEVPVIARKERSSVPVVERPMSPPADAFRLLGQGVTRAARQLGSEGNGRAPSERDRPATPPKTVLVTSAGPGEGKSTIAANLAAAYAELGLRSLVLSCDLRRPAVHEFFGVPREPGLAEALQGDAEVELIGHAWRTGIERVVVVPSGRPPKKPGELLGSDRMRAFLEQTRRAADVVVLDTSPILVASDVAPLLAYVDAVVLVARAGTTTAALAERTGELLRRLEAPVVGIVLNAGKEITLPRAYGRYYRSVGDGWKSSSPELLGEDEVEGNGSVRLEASIPSPPGDGDAE